MVILVILVTLMVLFPILLMGFAQVVVHGVLTYIMDSVSQAVLWVLTFLETFALIVTPIVDHVLEHQPIAPVATEQVSTSISASPIINVFLTVLQEHTLIIISVGSVILTA